jgi:hypothetical protein
MNKIIKERSLFPHHFQYEIKVQKPINETKETEDAGAGWKEMKQGKRAFGIPWPLYSRRFQKDSQIFK